MTWLTQLFVRIRNGFYGPAAYADAAQQIFPKGISYAFSIGLIGAITVVILLIPVVVRVAKIDITQAAVEKVYPGDLEIVIKNGVATTSAAQPYFLALQDVFPGAEIPPSPNTTEPKHLLAIDTTHSLTLEEVRAMDSFAVLGEKTIYFKKNDAEIRSYSLAEIKELTINKSEATRLAMKVLPILRTMMYFLPVVAFVFILLFSAVGHIMLGFIAAFIVKFVTGIRGYTLQYEQAFVVALFAMIPIAVLGAITDILGLRGSGLLNLAIFIALLIINFPQGAHKEEVPQSHIS
jgi:hypothetical protein